jgi:hypothetical protein
VQVAIIDAHQRRVQRQCALQLSLVVDFHQRLHA